MRRHRPDTTGVSCSINTAPSPDVLSCTDASLPAGGSWSVRITGTTELRRLHHGLEHRERLDQQ